MKKEESNYVCPIRKGSEEESVWRAFPNLVLPGKMVRVNRISHPDGVKICVDPNGQINLRAKQKYEVFSTAPEIMKSSVALISSNSEERKNYLFTTLTVPVLRKSLYQNKVDNLQKPISG